MRVEELGKEGRPIVEDNEYLIVDMAEKPKDLSIDTISEVWEYIRKCKVKKMEGE